VTPIGVASMGLGPFVTLLTALAFATTLFSFGLAAWRVVAALEPVPSEASSEPSVPPAKDAAAAAAGGGAAA
jgi:hypothetical protein